MATLDESPSAKRWLPLEANPDVMNQFLWGLGLPEEEAECYDVYGFDDELLEMVPKLVLAVLFLYPITQQSEAERSQQENVKRKMVRFAEKESENFERKQGESSRSSRRGIHLLCFTGAQAGPPADVPAIMTNLLSRFIEASLLNEN